jgi:CheY-like chemotaxis protein
LVTRHSPVPGQVVERQRFEALGRLAAGIAHDFNNMLAVISASRSVLSEVVKDTPQIDPVALECTEEIATATERARVLASRMLDFARSSDSSRATVDFSAICTELSGLLRGSIPRSVTILCNVDPGLCVLGNAAELHQLVMNLMLNARDAMADGGELRVTASRIPDSAPPALVVSVSDTGCGIAPEALLHIFEPFFSTKGAHGFGLGLATVQETAVTHGGKVDVRSKVGIGTTFAVTLPLAKPATTASLAHTRPPPSESHAARILLVDDEAALRRSLCRQLQRAGYEVVSAEDGRRALRLYADAVGDFDLVILDYDMPRLDGAQTFLHLHEMDPTVRGLLCSGYGDLPELNALRARGLRGVLRKPYTQADLIAAVREALTPAPTWLIADAETLTSLDCRGKESIRDRALLADTEMPADTIRPGDRKR